METELDNLRDKVLERLHQIIPDEEIVQQLEYGILTTAEKRCNDDDIHLITFYKQVYIRVLYHLLQVKNKETILKNLTKENAEEFALLSREVLYPEKWKELYDIRNEVVEKKKGAYQCSRCKSWHTEYVEVQTRAADESATVKVSCSECGHRWKLN